MIKNEAARTTKINSFQFLQSSVLFLPTSFFSVHFFERFCRFLGAFLLPLNGNTKSPKINNATCPHLLCSGDLGADFRFCYWGRNGNKMVTKNAPYDNRWEMFWKLFVFVTVIFRENSQSQTSFFQKIGNFKKMWFFRFCQFQIF